MWRLVQPCIWSADLLGHSIRGSVGVGCSAFKNFALSVAILRF